MGPSPEAAPATVWAGQRLAANVDTGYSLLAIRIYNENST